MPEPLRAIVGLLRMVSSRDAASADIGDILDELAERTSAGREPRWPGVWVNLQTLKAVGSAIVTGAPRLARSGTLMIRDAVRSLRRSPAHALFIMLILAIGIAAGAVTFSVVDAVVLRPLPFDHPEQLVSISTRDEHFKQRIAGSDVASLRRQLTTVGNLAAFASVSGDAVRVGPVTTDQITFATADFFHILGLSPQMGRLWGADAEAQGDLDVAVLSDRFWREKLNADPGVIGMKVTSESRSLTVIGVLSPTEEVRYLTSSAVLAPKTLTAGPDSFALLARMRPGVSTTQVADEVQRVMASPDWRPTVTPQLDTYVSRERAWMLLALGAAGLVVLIVCVNAANMMLTRSSERAHEMAIRASLGASRRQIALSVLAEGLVLSVGAAAAALLVSFWSVRVARTAVETMLVGVFRASTIALNGRVLVASIAAAAVTGVLFSSVPAWQTARASVLSLLKDGGPTLAGGRHRWRGVLLVAEIATVSVLLVASWLFVTSLIHAVSIDLGVDDRSRLLAVSSNMEFNGLVDDVQQRLERVPGVTGVAVSTVASLPLIGRAFGGAWITTSLTRTGAGASTPVETLQYRVTPNYFDVAGIRFRRGSTWSPDTVDGGTALVLDEIAARQVFGSDDPLGRQVRAEEPAGVFTVVGVVAHTYARGPEDKDTPSAYFPLKPRPLRTFAALFARTSKPAADVLPAVTDALAPFAPRNGLPFIHLADDAVRRITATRRFTASVMLAFGVIGMLIGAAGIYAVMTSVVSQQTREIGVRMALGATPPDIRRQVLASAARYLVAGLAIGLPCGWLASRGFAALFFRVTPADVSVYAGVALLLSVVAVCAVLIPARRAARVDPIVSLRA